jgi:hypothetical protein
MVAKKTKPARVRAHLTMRTEADERAEAFSA